jgi:hypothetical protein
VFIAKVPVKRGDARGQWPVFVWQADFSLLAGSGCLRLLEVQSLRSLE